MVRIRILESSDSLDNGRVVLEQRQGGLSSSATPLSLGMDGATALAPSMRLAVSKVPCTSRTCRPRAGPGHPPCGMPPVAFDSFVDDRVVHARLPDEQA